MVLVLVSGLKRLNGLVSTRLLEPCGENHRPSETRTRTGSEAGVSLPAHDLVCQQNPAHLGVLVLTLVDDGLKKTHLQVRQGRKTNGLQNLDSSRSGSGL